MTLLGWRTWGEGGVVVAMVIVEPRESGFVGGRISWVAVKGDKWVEIQRHRGKRTGAVRKAWDGEYAKSFRLLTKDSKHFILAVADTEDEIGDDASFIALNLTDQLSVFFERELGKKNRPVREKRLAETYLVFRARMMHHKQEDLLRKSVQAAAVAAASPKSKEEEAGTSGGAAEGDTSGTVQPPARLRGKLYKQGKVGIGTYKLRFFIQKGTKLMYFTDEEDPDPKGSIDLLAVLSVERQGKDLRLPTDGREWRLQALNVEDAEYWEAGLNEAIKGSGLTTYDSVGRNARDLAGLGLSEVPEGAFTDLSVSALFLHCNSIASLPKEFVDFSSLTELYLTKFVVHSTSPARALS
jgi:PH domain